MDIWENERSRWAVGTVCGCDEAGAGPLAGPVYAAAVVLAEPVPGLDDSKKLTEKRREALYNVITARALSWAVARVEAAEIDETDILSARMKAMQLAIDALPLDRPPVPPVEDRPPVPPVEDRTPVPSAASDNGTGGNGTGKNGAAPPAGVTAVGGVPLRPELALIDGNRDHGRYFSITSPHELAVGGDGLFASIAAASILAKVSRDRYVCRELDALYPQYQFAKHKGYGTKLHTEMLDRYGPCPAHRKTFLKKWAARRGIEL